MISICSVGPMKTILCKSLINSIIFTISCPVILRQSYTLILWQNKSYMNAVGKIHSYEKAEILSIGQSKYRCLEWSQEYIVWVSDDSCFKKRFFKVFLGLTICQHSSLCNMLNKPQHDTINIMKTLHCVTAKALYDATNWLYEIKNYQ